MKELLTIIGLFTVAHTLTWFQINGMILWDWMKQNLWFVLLFAIPIGYLFIKAVEHTYKYYGELWPTKIIGFSVGTIVFAILTYFFTNEGITLKTGVCLSLAGVIIGIQVLWK